MEFRIFCCFILLLGAAHATFEITVTPDTVNPGDDVTIECKVIDPQIGEMVGWYKRQKEGTPDVIGFNNVISNVAYSPRFTGLAAQSVGDNIFVYTLALNGALLEDSGEFGCGKAGVSEDIVYAKLVVESPLREITMYALPSNETENVDSEAVQLTDGQELEVVHGREYYLRCIATASNPAADVKITVGANDITDKFSRLENEYLEKPNGEMPKTGALLYVQNDVTLTSMEALTVDSKINGMQVSCTATVPGENELSISVKTVFKDLPSATCVNQRAEVYDRNVKVRCLIDADPEVTKVYWAWELNGKNETLTNEDPAGEEYEVTLKQDEATGQSVSELKIARVFDYHFGTYYFRAENDMGAVYSQASLEKDSVGESTGGAGYKSPSLLPITFFAAIISFATLRL